LPRVCGSVGLLRIRGLPAVFLVSGPLDLSNYLHPPWTSNGRLSLGSPFTSTPNE
jgi:hypothetical protein